MVSSLSVGHPSHPCGGGFEVIAESDAELCICLASGVRVLDMRAQTGMAVLAMLDLTWCRRELRRVCR